MIHDDTAIFTPEGTPLSDPGQIERALATLWKPPPEELNAEVATRVCVGNLLIVGRSADWGRFIEVLGTLSPRYPSRTVAILLGGEADPAGVRATVSALCHVPQPGRPQVCCEQIILRTGPCDGGDLNRTLLPLLEAEVPTMCWWTPDPTICPALFSAVRTVSDRFILDAGLAGLRHLKSATFCAVRELGWYRTARWRNLIAGMFDVAGRDALDGIDQINIEIASDSAEDRIDAIWLVAFLAGQLGWQPAQVEADDTYTFKHNNREVVVVVRINREAHGGLRSFLILSGDGHYEITRVTGIANQYRIIECDAHTCQLSRCVQSTPVTPANVLAMAFAGRHTDAAFSRAALVAAWMTQKT